MKTLYLFVFLVLVLFSCGKKTTINGRVYNPVTNEGIAGIEIRVTKPKSGLGYDGSGTKTVFTTTSDENGNFLIEERLRKSKSYTINYVYDKQKYKLFNEQVSPAGQEYDGETIEFPLVPLGQLKINLTNSSCFDSNDLLSVNWIPRTFENLQSNGDYNGCYSNLGSVNKVAMGWYVCIGSVTKNGITSPFADSIYVTEGGNHVWNIEY